MFDHPIFPMGFVVAYNRSYTDLRMKLIERGSTCHMSYVIPVEASLE